MMDYVKARKITAHYDLEDFEPALKTVMTAGNRWAREAPYGPTDPDFFGICIAVWTTNRIEIFLKEQAKSAECEED